MNLDPLAPALEEGAGQRVERAHLAFDVDGAAGEIELRLRFLDLGGIGDSLLGLRHRLNVRQPREYFHHQLGSDRRHLRSELARRFAVDLGLPHRGGHTGSVDGEADAFAGDRQVWTVSDVEQFDLHRTVNKEDVENSAWHYLCNARANTPKKAREDLIPVSKDARVPMKQVLELFAGKIKPKDVIDAAETAKLKDQALKEARFYAHLYVGIYHDLAGDVLQVLAV